MNIIQGPPGYTNKMMLDQLEAMLKAIDKTKIIKIGRGRNVITKQIPMYLNMEDKIKEIKNSIEHYKKNV